MQSVPLISVCTAANFAVSEKIILFSSFLLWKGKNDILKNNINRKQMNLISWGCVWKIAGSFRSVCFSKF